MRKLAAALFLSVATLSQQPQRPFRIISNVTEVALPVTILDPAEGFVNNIDRSEVTLLDNKTPQKLLTFEISFKPISMVILVDTSKRVESAIPSLRTSGVLFTQLVMGETGEAAVVTYDHSFAVRQEFTSNSELVEKAFKGLQAGDGGSQMVDGVFRALGMLGTRGDNRRKVIVVLGEGRNLGSESSSSRALTEAQLANVSIYTIELSSFKTAVTRKPREEGPPVQSNMPPGTRPAPPGIPLAQANAGGGGGGADLLTPLIEGALAIRGLWVHPLKSFATGTGSNHVNATSRKAVEEAVQRIGSELHSQYWVSYIPNNLSAQAFHTIEVKVTRPGVKVRNRPGYLYIPAESPEGR